MADSEVFVKLDFYEVISLMLSSFVVFFPGMSVSKVSLRCYFFL
jgi:hypothetical protein